MTGIVLANTILKLSFDEQNFITPMKLQKLLYFTYKQHLQKYEEKLFIEPFMKWKYGPVLESVYNMYSRYGSNPITHFCYTSIHNTTIVDMNVDSNVRESILSSWIKYRNYDAWDLSALTHQENTAWSKADYMLNDEDIFYERELY